MDLMDMVRRVLGHPTAAEAAAPQATPVAPAQAVIPPRLAPATVLPEHYDQLDMLMQELQRQSAARPAGPGAVPAPLMSGTRG